MQFVNPKAYRSLPVGILLFTKNIHESEILLLLIKGNEEEIYQIWNNLKVLIYCNPAVKFRT